MTLAEAQSARKESSTFKSSPARVFVLRARVVNTKRSGKVWKRTLSNVLVVNETPSNECGMRLNEREARKKRATKFSYLPVRVYFLRRVAATAFRPFSRLCWYFSAVAPYDRASARICSLLVSLYYVMFVICKAVTKQQ